MPRRPHLTTTRGLLASVIGVGFGCASCGLGSVDVASHDLEPGTEEICSALLEELPDLVSDAVRRDVADEPAGVAVWGAPPIVLRCGVPLPAEYRPDAQLLDVDGVGWLPVRGAGGAFFTVADRDPHVEVAVPDDYAPEAEVLADLAAAITMHLTERSFP